MTMTLSRLSNVNSFLDKYLFVLVFAIGTVGIGVLKYIGVSQLYVTLYPCVLILGYAAILLHSRKFKLAEDQSGDNLYYLGFLFTLISLALALYAFSSAANSTSAAVEEIIANFGIALSTTILGLMLRILFNQMRHDIVDVEVEARQELAQAATRLRSELDQVIVDMNHFGRATRQSLADDMQALSDQVSSSMQKSAEKFGLVAQDLAVGLEQTLSKFSNNAIKVNQASDEMVRAVNSLLERVEKIEAPSDLISNKIQPAIEAIQEAAAEVKKRTKGDEKSLAALAATLDISLKSSESLNAKVSSLLTSTSTAQLAVENFTSSANQAADLSSRLGGIASEVERSAKTHANLIERMDESAGLLYGSLNASLEKLQISMTLAVQNIASHTGDTEQKFVAMMGRVQEDSKVALFELLASSRGYIESMRENSKSLIEEVNKSRQLTLLVHNSLQEAVAEITDKLSDKPASGADNNSNSKVAYGT